MGAALGLGGGSALVLHFGFVGNLTLLAPWVRDHFFALRRGSVGGLGLFLLPGPWRTIFLNDLRGIRRDLKTARTTTTSPSVGRLALLTAMRCPSSEPVSTMVPTPLFRSWTGCRPPSPERAAGVGQLGAAQVDLVVCHHLHELKDLLPAGLALRRAFRTGKRSRWERRSASWARSCSPAPL